MGLGPIYEKIVVVTQKTALEELVERYNTREQARFYLEHMGVSFAEYQAAHDQYHDSLARLKTYLPPKVRNQIIERSFLPNFLFDPHDMVVTLGRDGLVINTGKYLNGQPLVAFNPDPQRIDGALIPFSVTSAAEVLNDVLFGMFPARRLTLAKATLNDGQTLHAVNDLFIGQRTQLSAYYRLRLGERQENQCSSGIIVSTGAGSTGWLRAILAGAAGVAEQLVPSLSTPSASTSYASRRAQPPQQAAPSPIEQVRNSYAFDPTAERLCFSVREPFVTRVTSADLVHGAIEPGQSLEVISHMPQNGVIFSDGVESDFLRFDSGAIANITIAEKKVALVTP
jgi:NAD kinase